MTDFDDVIEDLGPCGRFQIVLVLLVALFGVVPGMSLYFSRFSEAMPTWSCLPENISVVNDTFINTTIPSTVIYTNEKEDITLIETSVTNFSIDKCHSDGTFCDGAVFDSQFTSVRTEWNFCEEDFLYSAVSIVPIVGMFLGGLVFGQLIDTFGRKPILFLAYFGCLAAQAAISFAYIWHLYIVCKFVIGFCVSGVALASFILPVEIVGKEYRIIIGVPFLWLGGSMLLSLLAHLIPNWRFLSITVASLGVPVLFTWWLIPESPRWLIQKGRMKQADSIIQKVADWNQTDFPEFDKVNEITSQKHCIFKYSYCDLFRGQSMIRNIVIMCYIWFVCSMSYHSNLEKIGKISDNLYLNFFLLQASELPVFITIIIITRRIGRTKTLSALMMTSGLSCLVILLAETLGELADTEWHIKGFAMISKGTISGAWLLARIMAAELFPTLVRSIAIGANTMAAELGHLSVPVILSLNQKSKPLPVIAVGCLTLFCAVVSLFLPETASRTMPDNFPQRKWCGSRQSLDMPPNHQKNPHINSTVSRRKPDRRMAVELLSSSTATSPVKDSNRKHHENENGWCITDDHGTEC